jgi:opacity protein-like surface antigen
MQLAWLDRRRRMVFLAASLAVAASFFAAPAVAQAPPVLAPDTAPTPAAFSPPPGPAPVTSSATPVSIGGAGPWFGQAGQVAIGADLQLSLIRESGEGSSSTAIVIQPGLDYFVAPNISVGGLLSYAHGSAASVGTNTFGLQVRAGYNLQLSDTFSWWLRAGFGYFHGTSSSGGVDVSASNFTFQLYVPILFHPVPHLFIGFGPTITTDLATSDNTSKLTFLGLQSVVGGYFGAK